MTQDTGHLFVVHGRIESLVHDAAVLPVGSEFGFNRYWSPLVGSKPRRPARWHSHGWGTGGRADLNVENPASASLART